MTPPPGERGMALVSVLLIVALALAVLAIMLTGEDSATQRATRLAEAARARAVAGGGELSAVAALRRDGDLASDNGQEPWARIGERAAPIAGGTFTLAIADARGLLDLNPLARGDGVTRERLGRLLAAMGGLPADAPDRIAAALAASGPIDRLDGLALPGLPRDLPARLATVACALPLPGPINLNAAPEPVLAMLFNASAAHALAGRRRAAGRLVPEDLAAERLTLPPGTGFTSDLFWVQARATIGDTAQAQTSLLLRRPRGQGEEVVPIARWRGAGAPALPGPPG